MLNKLSPLKNVQEYLVQERCCSIWLITAILHTSLALHNGDTLFLNWYLLCIYIYSRALRDVFGGIEKLMQVSGMYVIHCSRIENTSCWRSVLYRRCYGQKCAKMCKNVQKHAKKCISSTYLSKNVQKRASQIFLDPIQKRALSRSVHLESVYLKALLYLHVKISHQNLIIFWKFKC